VKLDPPSVPAFCVIANEVKQSIEVFTIAMSEKELPQIVLREIHRLKKYYEKN